MLALWSNPEVCRWSGPLMDAVGAPRSPSPVIRVDDSDRGEMDPDGQDEDPTVSRLCSSSATAITAPRRITAAGLRRPARGTCHATAPDDPTDERPSNEGELHDVRLR
jgi:hypothetical protein